jgi:small neutral amino acid transporter SnatA (MarC family)
MLGKYRSRYSITLKELGKRGSLIVTRVFAVLIAAIAIEYIVDGVKGLF